MDRQQAIWLIKDHMEHHKIGEYPHILLGEALNMAIAALSPPNEPLSIEQLREMDGEPVWVVLVDEKFSGLNGWYLVHHGSAYLARIDDWELDDDKYGVEWLAYRRPPEGEEDT